MNAHKKKYYLREDTVVEKQKEDSLFLRSIYDTLLLEGLLECELAFILSFKTGVDVEDPRLTEERKRSIFFALNKICALRLVNSHNKESEFMDRNLKWISHFTDDTSNVIGTLQKQHITILGGGGLGALILAHLVMSGFRNFSIYDYAKVDPPDLNRQYVFDADDIGKFKVQVLKYKMERSYPQVNIDAHVTQIKDTSQLDKLFSQYSTFCVSCIDSPPLIIQAIVAEACMRYNVPVCFAGVSINDMQIGPMIDDSTCLKHYIAYLRDRKKQQENIVSSTEPIKASICYTNSLCADLTSFEIFKYLTKIDTPKSLNQWIKFNSLQYLCTSKEFNTLSSSI